MPTTSVATKGYEIREGMSGPADAKHRFIEAVVDGRPIVTALEYTPIIAGRVLADERPFWLLLAYQDTSDRVGVKRSEAARCEDADHARDWVNLLGALYAAAVAK